MIRNLLLIACLATQADSGFAATLSINPSTNVPVDASGFITPGTYGNVKLRDVDAPGGRRARFLISDGPTLDYISMVDVVIEAQATLTNLTMVFSHDFQPGPFGLVTATDFVTGFIASEGLFVPTGDKLTFQGYVKSEEVGPKYNLTITDLASQNFHHADQVNGFLAPIPYSMSGVLTLTLAAGHSLSLTQAGVQVNNVVPEPESWTLALSGLVLVLSTRFKMRRTVKHEGE